jgi:peptide chain release factor subunit 3
MLIQSGKISDLEIKKLKEDAEKLGRLGWWAAYLMDLNEEEREKGKTVDMGRATFVT